jgi:hypothetical protein
MGGGGVGTFYESTFIATNGGVGGIVVEYFYN